MRAEVNGTRSLYIRPSHTPVPPPIPLRLFPDPALKKITFCRFLFYQVYSTGYKTAVIDVLKYAEGTTIILHVMQDSR